MTIIAFPCSRRMAARRPRRSKNGTPDERAAKAAADPKPDGNRPKRQRWSKNGSPAARAAKLAKSKSGTILKFGSAQTLGQPMPLRRLSEA